MKIAERTAMWRRERLVLLRVSRAAWRLEQAEQERSWALASARAEGVSESGGLLLRARPCAVAQQPNHGARKSGKHR